MGTEYADHWEGYLEVSTVHPLCRNCVLITFRFHALYLPAILMALGAPDFTSLKTHSASQILSSSLPLPKKLLTHAHWTVSQQKMSKSVGNVVDPMQSLEKYGLDIVRFYLARVGGRFRDDVGT
jgi:methionyl-tRNA synthetase